MRVAFTTVLLLCSFAGTAAAQRAATSTDAQDRIASLTAGIGNTLGWFGVNAEKYLSGDRFSGFVGLGYTPEIDEGDPSGPTFAMGTRAYTAGLRHRGFLALSVSQLALQSSPEGNRYYGPGLEAGYQYAAVRGFTVMVSAGVGYAPGISDGASKFGEVVGLGFGYTWRR